MMAFCFSDSYINFLSKQNLSLLLHLFINLITMNSWVLLYFSGYNQYYFTRIIMLLKLLKSCWILAIRKFWLLCICHISIYVRLILSFLIPIEWCRFILYILCPTIKHFSKLALSTSLTMAHRNQDLHGRPAQCYSNSIASCLSD